MAFKLNFWSVFTFLWAAFIFYISVIPAEELPSLSLWKADKLAHAIVYFVLTISFTFTLKKVVSKSSVSKAAIIAAGSALVYGIFIEIVQGSMLVSRLFDVLDIVANTIGCVFGYLAVLILKRRGNKLS